MASPLDSSPAIRWQGGIDGHLRLLDQTLLPTEEKWLDCQDVPAVWEAIKMLRVRGAPAIGISAGYGACVSLRDANREDLESCIETARSACAHLATSRPTAVNLFWALDRMERRIDRFQKSDSEDRSGQAFAEALLDEAMAIHREDRDMCHAIGELGASLFQDGWGILTHCNAGGLATAEYGTAIAAIFKAQDAGKNLRVFADETRPLLQGARLTAWELCQRKVDCTVICDSMAAQVMREGKIQAVIVGADRITACGDTANKIGTYGVAILAKYHGIPFYVAAPTSTFDLSMISGNDIPIEQRAASEVTQSFGKTTAPLEAKVYNPAFDVTPSELITAIITEKGIIQPVIESEVRRIVG